MKFIRRPLALLLAVLLLCGSWFSLSSEAAKQGVKNHGTVTYKGAKCGVYTYNGSVAFCMEKNKNPVPSGTSFYEQIYGNENIRKALYYGYGGTKQWSGFESKAHAIYATSIVLSHYYSGTKIERKCQSFYDWLVKQPKVAHANVKLSVSSVKATLDKGKKIQKTPTIKLTADKSNYITLPLSSGVKLYNVTTKKAYSSGKVKVYGGQSFYLYASWTAKLKDYKSGTVKGAMKEFQAVLLKTSGSVQNLGTGRGVADPATTTSLTVKWLRPGKITVQKYDPTTKKGTPQSGFSFAGTTFKVCTDSKCKTTPVATLKIPNSKTSVTSGDLPQGTYYVQETKAATGYKLNSKIYSAKISAAAGQTPKTITVKCPNNPIKGNIEIWKTGEASDEQGAKAYPLKGAKFSVLLKGKTVKTGTTDAKGYLIFKGLSYGTYTVKETYAPKPFKCAAPFNVTINQSKTYSYKIKDSRVPTMLILEKHDAETKEVLPLAGITYDLYSIRDGKKQLMKLEYPENSGKYTSRFKTDEAGTVELPSTMEPGKYEFKEVETPPGSNYLVNDYTLPFTIDTTVTKNDPLVVEDYDYPQKGKIKLKKTDTDTAKPLQGAEFDVIAAENIETGDGVIRAEEGDIVAHLVTDEKGEAETPGNNETGEGALYLGKYNVVETKSPPGHELSKEEWPVTLTAKDRVSEVTVYDLEVTNRENSLEIQKVEAEPTGVEDDDGNKVMQGTSPLAGIKFRIWKAADEAVNSTMFPYEEYITGLDGKIKLKGITTGIYRVQEVETAEGYLLDNTIQTFMVDKDGYLDKSVLLFYNVPAKGTIEIHKTDSVTEKPVQGAEFTVIAAEEIKTAIGTPKVAAGDIVAHLVTDEDGKAATEPLYLGKYKVIETEQAAGYERLKDEWEITLTYEDQNTKLVKKTFEVKNTPNKVDVWKVEKESKKPLAGIRFLIWREDIQEPGGTVMTPTDAAEALLDITVATPTDVLDIPGLEKAGAYAVATTDEQGHFELNYLAAGTYHVKESQTLPGYVLDGTVQTFTVDEDGYVDNPKLEFTNDYTKLTVKKVKENDTPLAGAKLQLTDAEGTVIAEWITDKGTKRFERLPAGKYKLSELEAPAGYQVAEPMEFELLDSGEEQAVIMTDEKIPDEPNMPDVPDKPASPKKPNKPTTPQKKTGGPDTGNAVRWRAWLLLLIACGTIAVQSNQKQRKRYN